MAVTIQNLGHNDRLGTYDVKLIGGKNDNKYYTTEQTFRMKNEKEAKEFIDYIKKHEVLKQPSSDCFEPSLEEGFAPEKKPIPDNKPKAIKLLPKLIIVGCDMPEQGGISGNMNKSKPKPPFVCW